MHYRVTAYVDAFNLYYGLMAGGYGRFRWLDVPALVRAVLLPEQTLSATKYFTSRVTFPPDKIRRQSTYIDALKTLPGLSVIEGRYDGEPAHCDCGRAYISHNEKMTDVAIAMGIARDAYEDRFDTAILLTGDSDQVPSVQLVRNCFPKKRVVSLFPPERVSRHLQTATHANLTINKRMLRRAQLPDDVRTASGMAFLRPTEWQ